MTKTQHAIIFPIYRLELEDFMGGIQIENATYFQLQTWFIFTLQLTVPLEVLYDNMKTVVIKR